jgi:hypothetical protein
MLKKTFLILVLMLVIAGGASAQYEPLSASADKFAYLGFSMGNTEEANGPKAAAKMTLSSFSLEGGKLGWQIRTGRHGGFTIEPSLGYFGGIGLGNTIREKLTEGIGGNIIDIDKALAMLEKFLFTSGPHFRIAFGWRF